MGAAAASGSGMYLRANALRLPPVRTTTPLLRGRIMR